MKNNSNLKRLKKEYCAKFADVSKYENIYGGSIIEYMESTVGKVTNLERPHYLTYKDEIRAYECEIDGNDEFKLLFSVGLFAYQMKECIICLPKKWGIKYYDNDRYYFADTLPLDILRSITASVIKKNSKFEISENVYLDKTKSPWNKLDFCDEIKGLTFVDYSWTGQDENEEQSEDEVTLFTICPVFESKKSLTKECYQNKKSSGWHVLAFPFNDIITLNAMMHKAIENQNLDEIKAAVKSGASVNGSYFYEHSQFGLCMTDTYLSRTMWDEGMDIFKYKDNKFEIIKYLVEQGAEIPQDVLADIAWLGIYVTDYFIERGFDINAVDKVGYTALNRAESSLDLSVEENADKEITAYNEAVCEHIKALGGVLGEK